MLPAPNLRGCPARAAIATLRTSAASCDLTRGGLMTRAEGALWAGSPAASAALLSPRSSRRIEGWAPWCGNSEDECPRLPGRRSAMGAASVVERRFPGIAEKPANSPLDKLISTMLTVSRRSRGGARQHTPPKISSSLIPTYQQLSFLFKRTSTGSQAQLPRSAKSARLTTSSMPFASSWRAAENRTE
jgi:hypothetical protein